MRKLRVLPEVLPAPTKSDDRDGPRSRTLAHMRRLLSVAAVTHGMSATGCSKEDPLVVKAPDDVVKKNKQPEPAPAPSQTASAEPSTSPSTSIDPGYMVVDMLPPPAACAGAAPSIKGSAKWDASASEIVVTLSASSKPDVHVTYPTGVKPGAPSAAVSNGTIVSTSVVGGGATIRIKKDAGATSVFLFFPLDCKSGKQHLSVYLDVSKPPSAGAVVPLTLADSW